MSRIKELLERAQGKEVAVFGSGKTGIAVASLLLSAGYKVTLVDETEILTETASKLKTLGAKLISNWTIAQGVMTDWQLAVLSPGISLEGNIAQALGQAGVPRVSELDLAVAYLGMPEVAVTGTNGKTTVVELITHMLNTAGIEAAAVGNVGTPMVSFIAADDLRAGKSSSRPVLVCEVSSYQLEAAFDFSPAISVFLNLGEDHLERHSSMEEYARIKARIFSGQTATDWSIINQDDPWSSKISASSKGRLCNFSTQSLASAQQRVSDGVFVNLAQAEVLHFLEGKAESYSLKEFALIGSHNKANAAAAICAARRAGASQRHVQLALNSFVAPAHRLEYLGDFAGVKYVNDSKATNPAAVVAAINSLTAEMKYRNLILLLGGRQKRASWQELAELMIAKVKSCVVYGESATEISQHIQQATAHQSQQLKLTLVENLAQALQFSRSQATFGDLILLSPGCASFDHYRNFEERGNHFRNLVFENKNNVAA